MILNTSSRCSTKQLAILDTIWRAHTAFLPVKFSDRRIGERGKGAAYQTGRGTIRQKIKNSFQVGRLNIFQGFVQAFIPCL
jgi:hypothetical protein